MEVWRHYPVKFLVINHEYPPVGGGAATASREMAENLHSLGHDVAVLTARYGGLPRVAIESGVTVHRVSCVRKQADRSNVFEMFAFMLAALLGLRAIFARQHPDALITFFSLPSGLIGLVAKIFTKKPYVVSLRGGDVPVLVPELARLHKIISPMRRRILENAEAVVANSESLRRLSEASDHCRVRVVPNGVNTDFFQPNPMGSTSSLAQEILRILFVGRFQRQKNLEFLLYQLAALRRGSFALRMVGDGPQKRGLQELAAQLEIADSTTWDGWMPRADLPGIYQSADCFVNPSLYEGMPNVVLEAMACGLPVIASRIDVHETLVSHGETGFLFELNNPAMLASALAQMEDVDLRLRMGQQARARAQKLFSWKSVASSYADLFAPEHTTSALPGS